MFFLSPIEKSSKLIGMFFIDEKKKKSKRKKNTQKHFFRIEKKC